MGLQILDIAVIQYSLNCFVSAQSLPNLAK
uniref:Uncharacterized protein n=1 Tax=Anguilla anguilla TaxID=7936 RepID=A0A0E9RTW9_ANGAN